MTDQGARRLVNEVLWGLSAGLAVVLAIQGIAIFGPDAWNRLLHPPCTPTITVADTRPLMAGDCVDAKVFDALAKAIHEEFYAASSRPMDSMCVPACEGPP